MDSYTKTGKVYLQPHKTGKKWKPVLLSLLPPTSSGVGRLEIQHLGGGGAEGDHGSAVRRHHPPLGDRKLKVVRLSELIRVLRLPPNAEACPMENMSAFCVETQERTLVFAALKDDCVDWVEKLCNSTFQGGGGSGSNEPHMEENQIYASAGEVSEFWVVVQSTDAATRCGLQGSHWLQVGRAALQLRETQKKRVVREWPYELLRRYGKDKMTLTIEAGRRCDSGPGMFIFETQQAEKIFSLIQSTIRRKTSAITPGNQNQEGEKVIVTNIQAHSPLPIIPNMTNMTSILGKDLRTEERKRAASEESTHIQAEVVVQAECVSAQPAPITLMPLPLVPTQDSPSVGRQSDQPDPVYADPAECIQSIPKLQLSSALYVDPASVLPLKLPSSRETVAPLPTSCTPHPHPDSVYSEVYDRVSPVQSKQAVSQSKCFADEPIYTEPLNDQGKVSHKDESKPEPFAHLYAQVCKRAPSSNPSTSFDTTTQSSAPSSSDIGITTTTKDMDQSLDDVIYENLGII
ncbi:docking protein 3 [Scophthalmus maximus]|uniref:IRS-type PTB domain-containing protein n=1 Tax=Scophthalmus maximus TaxID=52904 RepID=A0A8D3DH47_SCOMX|nr:docking protein 3 [Scophthalmus maximus]